MSKGLIWQFDSGKLNCQKDWFGKLYCQKKGRIWQFDSSKKLNCQKKWFGKLNCPKEGKLYCPKEGFGNLVPANWIVKRRINVAIWVVKRIYWAILFRQTEISRGSIWQIVLSKGRIWQFNSSKLDCQKKNQCSKLSCRIVQRNENWIVQRKDLVIWFWQIELSKEESM